MRKSFSALLLVVAFAMCSAVVASAHPVSPRIDRREWRQHQRIRHGQMSGRLTAREMGRLRAGQHRIHQMENRAKCDGRFTGRERMRINRMQNRQSRQIWRMKHNGRGV